MNNVLDKIFKDVKRKNFLPPSVSNQADYDAPLPIGYGVTNSQPSTVRMMLEWLDVLPGQKILDVGSGSGWTTALLARLIGDNGKVIATERVPELVTFGRDNCQRLGINNVVFYQAEQLFGRSKDGPYDRILVSAAANEVPTELLDQLAKNGRMVIPVCDSILEITKDKSGNLQQKEHPGFMFVPLIKD